MVSLEAGNPDRQGEAGAYELLMVPYARTAGLHLMNTAFISGVESIRLNVAGLARINKTEIVLGSAQYLKGTGINMSSLGLAQKAGANGAFGFSLMALDFGDIPVTTTLQPEGTGSTFSPTFFNLGLSYAHIFENKISVGVTVRVISEALADVTASAVALDAGVQYVTGPKENFKFGISLRNVGSRMSFGGEGLSQQLNKASFDQEFPISFDNRSAAFELPSVLNIGLSYDLYPGEKHRLTLLGNFTANSFSEDQIGGGAEYSLDDLFMLRGAYKYDFGSGDPITEPIYTGLSAGASVAIPFSKENKNVKMSIDYAYRETKIWNGTHNIGVRINI
ncbi:MAG: PorV/PorQ family protein [Saprospiraceae bacterium]|nr:PorV/PorQ family protein [Saprospiraceae bacterium]